MLDLILNNYKETEAKRLLFQFEDFMKHGGLLPSCSIYVHTNLTMEVPPAQNLLKAIGSFDFYSCQESYYIGYHYFRDQYALLKIDNQFTEINVYYKESGFELNHSEMANPIYIAYRYRALECDCMMIHAAAIIYEGEGILFCGASGAGKSTQANLWRYYLDTEILNYDKPCLIPHNIGWVVHGTPWSGKEGIYKNKYVPLKAIVFVEKSSHNYAYRLSKSEAFMLLYLNNYIYPLNDETEHKCDSVITNIVEDVPVYKLQCDVSKEAVQVLFKEIYGIDWPGEKE